MRKKKSIIPGFINAACPYAVGLALCFLAAGFIPAAAEEAEGHKDEKKEHYSAELSRGERLFYGLIEGKGTAPACATCHNVQPVDSINWYPAAYEIAALYSKRDLEAFRNVLTNPITPMMSKIHVNFNFTDADIELLKGYLDHIAVIGPKKSKPIINELLLFIFLGLIMTFFLVDLMFLKRIKKIYIHWTVITIGVALQLYIVIPEAIALGRQKDYEPDQPIKFSHRIHVTENQMDCLYCHHTAEHSKSAGFPSTGLCLNCHELVRDGSNSGRFEINKIHLARENNEPIEWIRIHNLADHAFFSHAQHVTIGKIDCQVCHGLVEEMDRVYQVSDLSMGWCINCHRETEVQFFDNAFYDKYEELHEQFEKGLIDHITVEMVGGLDCSKCHY